MNHWTFDRDAIRVFRFVRCDFDAQTGIVQLAYAFDDGPELVETVVVPGAPFALDDARAAAAEHTDQVEISAEGARKAGIQQITDAIGAGGVRGHQRSPFWSGGGSLSAINVAKWGLQGVRSDRIGADRHGLPESCLGGRTVRGWGFSGRSAGDRAPR